MLDTYTPQGQGGVSDAGTTALIEMGWSTDGRLRQTTEEVCMA
jgi:hypothetical protein